MEQLRKFENNKLFFKIYTVCLLFFSSGPEVVEAYVNQYNEIGIKTFFPDCLNENITDFMSFTYLWTQVNFV